MVIEDDEEGFAFILGSGGTDSAPKRPVVDEEEDRPSNGGNGGNAG